MRQWTQWGPLPYGNALCGSYLISLQGLALQLLQCEKEKKKGGGRGRGGRRGGKEGRKVHITGREEVKGDL